MLGGGQGVLMASQYKFVDGAVLGVADVAAAVRGDDVCPGESELDEVQAPGVWEV